MFAAFALEYSGWKLNGVPVQSAMLVFMNPFAAEAIIVPLWPVVRSCSRTSNACPPGHLRVEHVDHDAVALGSS